MRSSCLWHCWARGIVWTYQFVTSSVFWKFLIQLFGQAGWIREKLDTQSPRGVVILWVLVPYYGHPRVTSDKIWSWSVSWLLLTLPAIFKSSYSSLKPSLAWKSVFQFNKSSVMIFSPTDLLFFSLHVTVSDRPRFEPWLHILGAV